MNKRGLFLGLSACLIFLVGISLMQNYVIEENNNFSGEFLKAKAKITNYEIVLSEIVQDCNWKTNLLNCADTNSDLLLTQMNSSGKIICSAEPFSSISEGIRTKINCSEELVNIEKVFTLDVNKEVIIQKIEAS
jgi:hypothetical protein